MTLHEILVGKGTEVFTTTRDATLQRVVEIIVEAKVGSLVVVDPSDDKKMIGIITERDIMNAIAAGKPLRETSVVDVMTTDVITGRGEDSVSQTMSLLTEKRIRHLPVVQNGMLVGMISIGDVVKSECQAVAAENHHLKTYIQS